jgi:hypothetical protein
LVLVVFFFRQSILFLVIPVSDLRLVVLISLHLILMGDPT